MDIQKLDQAIVDIIDKKNKLNKLTYADKDYDVVEEELHDLEDDFIDEFGDYMENALSLVHDDYCPDNDLLLPTAYFAKKYNELGNDGQGKKIYDVDSSEGVLVEVEEYPGVPCRLVILPNPVRIVLQISKNSKETVWTSK